MSVLWSFSYAVAFVVELLRRLRDSSEGVISRYGSGRVFGFEVLVFGAIAAFAPGLAMGLVFCTVLVVVGVTMVTGMPKLEGDSGVFRSFPAYGFFACVGLFLGLLLGGHLSWGSA